MIDVRKRLQEELNVIDRELRVELPKEILKAREHGDLSENAEYKAAKERQSYLEGRKAQLQQRMASLSLVNLEKIPTDRAAYGSKVVLTSTIRRRRLNISWYLRKNPTSARA